MRVGLIVAANEAGFIGKDNDLLWKNKQDMAHFKAVTTNQIVVMGRKTFESMGSKPLPNRVNIVVTQDTKIPHGPGMIMVETTLERALSLAQELSDMEGEAEDLKAYLIGGKRIYEEGMPYVTDIHLTRVHNTDVGDTQIDLNFPDKNPGMLDSGIWNLEGSPKPVYNGEKVEATIYHYQLVGESRPIPTNKDF